MRRWASAAACRSASTARHQLSWWTFGGGGEIVNASLKKLNVVRHPGRAHRRADGRLVQEGDQRARGSQGPELPRRRRWAARCWRGSAWCRSNLAHADVYAALENGTIDAAEFICPHDDEKLGLVQGGEVQPLPLLVGKRRHAAYGRSTSSKWNALPKSYQAILCPGLRCSQRLDARQVRRRQPTALKRLVAAGAILKPFPMPVLEACHKAAGEHHAEMGAKDPGFKKAYELANNFRKEQAPGGRSPNTPTIASSSTAADGRNQRPGLRQRSLPRCRQVQ